MVTKDQTLFKISIFKKDKHKQLKYYNENLNEIMEELFNYFIPTKKTDDYLIVKKESILGKCIFFSYENIDFFQSVWNYLNMIKYF